MTTNSRRLYGLAATLAAIGAILQFIDGDWFRGATSALLSVAMALAATGFPEKSTTNMRIYYAFLAVAIAGLALRLFTRFG